MDLISCFYNNGYLFKCSHLKFDNVIKKHMKSLMSIVGIFNGPTFDNESVNLLHCLICFQYVGHSYFYDKCFRGFTICENCCYECIDKKVSFMMDTINLHPTFGYKVQEQYNVIEYCEYYTHFPEFHDKIQVL